MTTHYFINALVAAALALCLTGCAITPRTVLYVSPSGNDAWSGARLAPNASASDGPFATLDRARDEIRARRRAGTLPPGDIEIRLVPGTYALAAPLELAAQDSGLTGRIVYRAAKRGTAVLSGAATLEGWCPVSDPAVLNRLDPAARGHVLTATLPEQRFPSLPGFASGFGTKNTEYPVALYQANDRLPIARWPNQGFVKTGECLGNSNTRSHEGRSFTDGVFKFEDPRLARWVGEPELWFNGLWFVPWADEKIRLKAIDPVAQPSRWPTDTSSASGKRRTSTPSTPSVKSTGRASGLSTGRSAASISGQPPIRRRIPCSRRGATRSCRPPALRTSRSKGLCSKPAAGRR